jgi:D-alanyl-D-alanine carboxypeptidase/D-alanyl-D-alanine-endopeptidase (penicillin-binding protein 4)
LYRHRDRDLEGLAIGLEFTSFPVGGSSPMTGCMPIGGDRDRARFARARAWACFVAAGVACGCIGPAVADDQLPPVVSAALRRAAIPESAVAVYVQQVGAFESNRAAGEVMVDAGLTMPGIAASAGPRGKPARKGLRADSAPLLSLHVDQAMNPASTMKLVTTYAALELLGPAFTWKTAAASNAPQLGDSLEGDLYLRGAGDPKFVLESFWLLLRQLRNRGIKTIKGDLVLDHSLFEALPYDPSAFDQEPFRPYNVGPDALLVNFKAVALRFMPDDTRREVRVAMEPTLADVSVGPLAYADGACGDWKARLAADFTQVDRIAFNGAYAGSCGEQTWNVAILDHRQYVGALFRSLWGELGGTLLGAIRDGTVPADAHMLVERESPSLAEIVRDINKYSNNVMARELYLSLAAETLKTPANAERAQRAVRSFYANKGMALPELVLENGSGLSRRERISAFSMGRVLQAAWSSPVMPELMSSLPLVGFDGTMRKRMTLRTVAGQAHIKTGTLNDVRTAAGYVLAASGKRYVVVAFINHPNAGGGQPAQDALLQWVYDQG